jgi:hypothetical protein
MSRLVDMARFDEDNPESFVVATCEFCKTEITVGTEVARIDDSFAGSGGFVHEWCAMDYAIERIFDATGVIGVDGDIE